MQSGYTTSWRKFRFLRQLGRGGFGEVYLAEMNTGGGFTKPVAVKVLRADFVDDDEIFGRLEDEARLLGQLRHPNIVQADDLVFLGGRLSMVMEYIPGANLNWVINPRLNPEPIPGRLTLQIIRRIADALAAAWSRPTTLTGQPLRVLHRDIKPSNIRITADGEIKVLDFGVARVEAFNHKSEAEGVRVGSRPYMAPETLLDKPIGPTTDIYSLGVLLYETAARLRFGRCGLEPHRHHAEVEARLERAIFRHFNPVADEVVALIREMTAFDPGIRPQAALVVDRLRALEQQLESPPLDEWCALVIPQVVENHKDPEDGELVGQTLSVGTRSEARSPIDAALDGGDISEASLGASPAPTLAGPAPEEDAEDDVTELSEAIVSAPVVSEDVVESRPLPGEPDTSPGGTPDRRRGVLLALLIAIAVVGALGLSFAMPGAGERLEEAAAASVPPTIQERARAAANASPQDPPAGDEGGAGSEDGAEGGAADPDGPADAEEPPEGVEPAADAGGEAGGDAGAGAAGAGAGGDPEGAAADPGYAPAGGEVPDEGAGAASEGGEAPQAEPPGEAPQEAAPQAGGPPQDVAFSSRPLGVGVVVDGVFRGNTPLRIQLSPGPHSVAFEQGGASAVKQIQVAEGQRNLWTFYEAEGVIR
jgi:serine/threonine protein kinase